jgi:ribonuclease HI
VVYTDGASSNNGQNHARAGYGVYYGDNDSRNASVRLPGRQTNQRAEASAAVNALKQNRNTAGTLEIRTDLNIFVEGPTNRSKNWRQHASNGSEVQIGDLFQRMTDLAD